MLDKVPVDRHFRVLAPILPVAFRSLGTFREDLVISSSSGWAHGIRTAPNSFHVVYCYAPARWLYSSPRYARHSIAQALLSPFQAALRHWDQAAARRADLYIVIAENVKRRVKAAYGVEADVVYPPVDVRRFTPTPRGSRLLVVSRLLPYKRIDLAVRAATMAGLPLDVVGSGPAEKHIKSLAGPTVTMHGKLDDASVTEMIEGCGAVIVPGAEDFGIVPVEANAAGKPVVALAAGGALETVVDRKTGILFRDLSPESLLEALRRVESLETSPDELAAAAQRFSPETFRKNLVAAIARARLLKE